MEEKELKDLKEAAIEYGEAFASTDPKQPSDRRITAHQRLTQVVRRYYSAVRSKTNGATRAPGQASQSR